MYSNLSKQQLLRRLFSNAGLYGVSLILMRVGSLMLLPIYVQKLDPADFGVIGLAQLTTVFLGPVLNLGLYDAVQRLYHDWSEDDRPFYIAALWSVSLAFSALICLGLYFFGKGLFAFLISQVAFSPYIELAILIAFASNLNLFPLTLMRAREDLKQFSLVTIGMFVTQAAAILFFLFQLDWKSKGYLAGMLVSGMIWGIYFLAYMFRETKFPWRVKNLREPFRYSLPTFPASIMEGAGSIFDRYFLDRYASLSAIGFYNLGNQFGSIVNSFNQILKASWVPFIYRVIGERKDGPSILGRFTTYYVAAMAVLSLAVAVLAKDLIELLASGRFAGVYPFVPWFSLIYYFQSVGTAMGRGLDLAKKTIFNPIIPAIGIVSNFFLMYFLVPRWGVWGVVTALLITTVLRICTQIGLGLVFYPRPLFLLSLLKVNVIALAFFFLACQVNTGHLSSTLAAKSCLVILSAAIIAWSALDWKMARGLLENFYGQLKW